MQTCTVISALTAVGQEIALACGVNPTNLTGSNKIIPQLHQTHDGWQKEDPPTIKQLPIEADVPEFLACIGLAHNATALERVVGDMTFIAFYYLLQI